MALTKIKADGLTADLIDETKLADNSIDSEHYNDGSIDEAHIADDAVTADKLANAINTSIAGKAVLTGSTDNQITTVTGANAIQGEANLTYDGDILHVGGGGSSADGSRLDLKHGNNNTTDVISSVTFSNTVGEAARIQGETSGANNSGVITFHTDNAGTSAERLRIDSSGNVGVGITSPTTKIHSVQSDASAGNNIILDNNYSGGGTTTFLKAYRSGGAVGYGLQYKDSTTTIRQGTYTNHPMEFFTNDAARLTLETSGNVTLEDGDLVIGTNGHGIDFSATPSGIGGGTSTSAQILDEYEEGSWTPTMSANVAQAYGTYTRVGRMVNIWLYMQLDSNSTSSNVVIAGMPFTPWNTVPNLGGNIVVSNAGSAFNIFADNASTSLYVRDLGNTSVPMSDLSGKFFYATAAYQVA